MKAEVPTVVGNSGVYHGQGTAQTLYIVFNVGCHYLLSSSHELHWLSPLQQVSDMKMYPKNESLSLKESKNLFTRPAGHGQSPDSETDETASFCVWESHNGISSVVSGSSFEPFSERPFLEYFKNPHVFCHGHGFVM